MYQPVDGNPNSTRTSEYPEEQEADERGEGQERVGKETDKRGGGREREEREIAPLIGAS